MNIISALMKVDGIRISYQDKWLLFEADGNDSLKGDWVICQRKYGAKKTRVLCQSESQEEAVKILLGG